MSRSALAVDADPVHLALTARVLADLGYDVLTASTFDDANRQIQAALSLSLLISDVRLGEFNGIHLALRARTRHPNVLVVITQDSFDPTLEFEAKQLRAAYCLKPATSSWLASAIADLSRAKDAPPADNTRRWPRKQVGSILRARVNDREALLRDISYGGLCVEFSTDEVGPLPPTTDVLLPQVDLSVKVHLVWARIAAQSPNWLCGSEVIEGDQQTLTLWQQFVDGCP
jgi:CheY-like chemotaxis protein